MKNLVFFILFSLIIYNVNGNGNEKVEYEKYSVVITQKFSWRCSGALINPSYVLTVAHCIINIPAPDIVLIPGIMYVSDLSGYPAQEVIIHPEFPRPYINGTNVPNDIGLIQLREPIIFNPDVQPIPLSIEQNPEYLSNCKLVLFRSLSTRQRWIITSRLFDIVVTTFLECKKYYNKLLENQLCISEAKERTQFQPVDYGSPTICNGKLFGILSDSVQKINLHGQISIVSPHLKWISDVINPMTDE